MAPVFHAKYSTERAPQRRRSIETAFLPPNDRETALKWRERRPRLSNGARERALGFVDRDLRHGPTGAWYTYEEARAASEEHHRKILAARADGPAMRADKPQREGTMEDLLDDWLASPEVTNLKPASIASYRKLARAIIFRPETRSEAKERRERERAAAVLGVGIPEREREEIAKVTPRSLGAPELRRFFKLPERRAWASHGTRWDSCLVGRAVLGARKLELAAAHQPADQDAVRPAGGPRGAHRARGV